MSENNVPGGTSAAGPHETPDPVAVIVRTERGDAVRGDRTDGVLSWIGWHLGELAAVGLPTVLAVTTHPLWTVPAVIVAAGWVAHEMRLARQRTTPTTASSTASSAGAPSANTHRPDMTVGGPSTARPDMRPDEPVSPLSTGPVTGPVSGEEGRRGLA